MDLTDSRIAALYDIDNPGGADHDYYRRLTARLDSHRIIDLGCGTGLLTVTLAGPSRTVIGIDPDEAMLTVARNREGGERVAWVIGDSGNIGDARADLILMTGNVAQHVVPADWQRTLTDIAEGLRPGGLMSFESRNPTVGAWRTWTREQTWGTRTTPSGRLTEWIETTEPDEHGTIVLTAHNVWEDTNEDLVVTQPLTFRDLDQVSTDLAAAGLSMQRVMGGWQDEPFTEKSAVMVVEACLTLEPRSRDGAAALSEARCAIGTLAQRAGRRLG
ncbi:MAG: class I SAM-dependent methyltransferase [Actinomycetota bacterium]|jgi:SAM-dependent methyltransferase